MDLHATITLAELQLLLEQATPLRIHSKDERRWIEIDRPSEVQLVAGRGLRVRTSGRLQLGRGELKLPLRIKTITLMLAPVLREGQKLGATVEVEALDVAYIPGVVDSAIRSAVNNSLAQLESSLVWAVGKTLHTSKRIPPRLEPLALFLLATQTLHLVVEEDRVELGGVLTATVTRAAEPAAVAPDASP